MQLTQEQANRAMGVLVGTASGDALGAGYEFTTPNPDIPIGLVGGGIFHWKPGEWTDDTSMALAVAIAASYHEDISTGEGLDAVAAGFTRWYDYNPPDIGNQTRAVLSGRCPSAKLMLERSKEVGRKTRSTGNGSLMRTAPVALAYLDYPDKCVRAAGVIGALTHYEQRAIEACQIWSYAIRHAVLEGNFDGVRQYLSIADRTVCDYWSPLLDVAETGGPEDFQNNGWVVHALQTAWWAINRADQSSPSHLVETLERCVYAGNDTDTTAAIAGGLVGARWGIEAVPTEWESILHGYPGMDNTDLVTITESILALH